MASKRPRIGHRLLLKMGIRDPGPCPKFSEAQANYDYLKSYVDELQGSMSSYALQLARTTEAARLVGEDSCHLFLASHSGFKPAIAFKDAQEQTHSGYAGQVQQAFVRGVLDPIAEWYVELCGLEKYVTQFNEVRIQHDHYRLKVQELRAKAELLEARAATRGDSKDAKAAAERLRRNTEKLNEWTSQYEKILRVSCENMGLAWNDRLRMMNNIIARVIRFQESYLAEQMMNAFGVSRILDEAGGTDWGGAEGIEPFIAKGHVRHYEGALILRKNTFYKEPMWFRLVGSKLEVYDMKDKESDPQQVVVEAPTAQHEVKGVTKLSSTTFRVIVPSVDGALHLLAADEADGQGWIDALTRASEWDQLSSSAKVESQVRESKEFLNCCKTAYASTTTTEELERTLGVTDALENPPAAIAIIGQSTAPEPETAAGDSAASASGGGGGEEAADAASSSGGGETAAAGIAPGGEAGVPSEALSDAGGAAAEMAAAVALATSVAATAAASKKGEGKKGKKGKGERVLNMPAGMTGGPGPMPGMMPGLASRRRAGNMGGGPPLGMPSGRMVGGARSSSMNGMTPFAMARMQSNPSLMGHGPPQMARSVLPPGLRQNGPPIMLPPGMIPRGGGPLINPPVPPPMMNGQRPMMDISGGGSSPWGAGNSLDGGGMMANRMANRSAGARFGSAEMQLQHQRQAALRRSRSFGGNYMSSGAGFPPALRPQVSPYDDMLFNRPGQQASDMMFHRPGPSQRLFSTKENTRDTDPTYGLFGASAVVGAATAAAAAASAAAARAANGEMSPPEEKKKEEGSEGGGEKDSPPPAEVEAPKEEEAEAAAAPAEEAKEEVVPDAKDAAAAATAAAAAAAAGQQAAPPSEEQTGDAMMGISGRYGGLTKTPGKNRLDRRSSSRHSRPWKRMMSLGSSATSYRYDMGGGPEEGVSGEFDTSDGTGEENDNPRNAKSNSLPVMKMRSERWNLRKPKAKRDDYTIVRRTEEKVAASNAVEETKSDDPSQVSSSDSAKFSPGNAQARAAAKLTAAAAAATIAGLTAARAKETARADAGSKAGVGSTSAGDGTDADTAAPSSTRSATRDKIMGAAPFATVVGEKGAVSPSFTVSLKPRGTSPSASSASKSSSAVASPSKSSSIVSSPTKATSRDVTVASRKFETALAAAEPKIAAVSAGQRLSIPSSISDEDKATNAAVDSAKAAADRYAAERKAASEKDTAKRLAAAYKYAAERKALAEGGSRVDISTAPKLAAEQKASAEAKYAAERKASAEAASRVDASTGLMKNLTLADLMLRSSKRSSGGGAKVSVTALPDVGASCGGGSSNFEVKVRGSEPASNKTGPTTVKGSTTSSRTGTMGTPTTITTIPSLVVPPPTAAPQAAAPPPTPAAVPLALTATPPAPVPTPTPTPSPAKTVVAIDATPKTVAADARAKEVMAAATAAAAVAATAAAAAAATAAAAAAPPTAPPAAARSGTRIQDGNSRAVALQALDVPESPDTPASVAQATAKVKVFHKLCETKRGSEAEAGRAGGGAASSGFPSDEKTMSFQQLMWWDEVQELVESGAITKREVEMLWAKAIRYQGGGGGGGGRSVGDTAKDSQIWASDGGIGGTGGSSLAGKDLNQKGFLILVKLIEELHYETSLKQEHGVELVKGEALEV